MTATPPPALRRAFVAFDEDGSGSISAAELKEILTRTPALGSGQEPSALTDDDVAAILADADANGDGSHSTFEEFIQLMRRFA